ncbi:MAG: hypothetical protein LBT85_04105, partial [Bifidobacteriaceae bacterium]|nr:hypothetical protein [Bifidobacteriaceae bacterium]
VLAIRQELLRSGQVFYIHNNIFTIDKVVLQLQEKLSAKAEVAAAHSKLDKNELDKITNDFYQGKIDVLVCTTIIETGIDISNANTIIIDQADKLGLVQLHQIRGRVGRSAVQSFCYLFYDKAQLLSSQSYKRLETIVENQQLGSGLTIAMRDLELRGAGNFLGSEQSGKIEGVGYDLYTKMVTEALEIYKNGNLPSGENVIMETDFNIHIPHTYIYEQSLRLEIYRKIDLAKTGADLKLVKEELQDRFGKLPEQVENILIFQKIKNLSSAKGVRSIIVKQGIAKIDKAEFSFKISFDKKTSVHLFDKKRLIQLYDFVKGGY